MKLNKFFYLPVRFICSIALLSIIGCSPQPTSTIEIPSGSATSTSINGKQFEVRDGIVTYNGQKIEVSVPENSSLKITHTNTTVCIYVDDKLVHKE